MLSRFRCLPYSCQLVIISTSRSSTADSVASALLVAMGRFAELPNEIKDIILKHFFTGKLVQYIPCDARMSELKVRTLVNMLSVCRNLFGRRQVSEAMLRYSTIRIDQVEGLKHVQNMQPVHRKMIRKLQFAVKNDNLYAENIDVYLPNLSIIELVTGHVEIEAPTESQIFANFKSKPIGNIGYVLDEQCALDHGPQFDASRLTIASQDSMDPLASGAFEVGGIWCYDPGMWADSSYIVGFKIFDRGINSDARAFLERAVGAGIEVMVTVELSLHPAKDGLARQCGCGIKLPVSRVLC